MAEGGRSARRRKWHDSGDASLCGLGGSLRRIGVFRPRKAGLKLKRKVLKYTPGQKPSRSP